MSDNSNNEAASSLIETKEQLAAALTDSYAGLYRELFEGVPRGQPSWITSGGPEGGVNGAIAGLTAEQASRSLNGVTLASHVEHLRWAVQVVNDYYDGKASVPEWSESWLVSTVDDAAWSKLRQDLRVAGDTLLTNLREPIPWDQPMGRQAMLSSYGHTAYHLGAIKQMCKQLGG